MLPSPFGLLSNPLCVSTWSVQAFSLKIETGRIVVDVIVCASDNFWDSLTSTLLTERITANEKR